MARRQAAVLRNLDDPLRVLGLLSLRSCGFVFLSYAGAAALELALGLFTAAFGSLAFLGELGCAAIVAFVLGLAERTDDEHLVPAAIQYYLDSPGRVVWSGHGSDRLRGQP
jgi:hypothetical protein